MAGFILVLLLYGYGYVKAWNAMQIENGMVRAVVAAPLSIVFAALGILKFVFVVITLQWLFSR